MERSGNRTIGWCVGDRSTKTFRKFYQKFEHLNAKFYADDWTSYTEVIPKEKLWIGKKYTVGIEQNNSNTRTSYAVQVYGIFWDDSLDAQKLFQNRLKWYWQRSKYVGILRTSYKVQVLTKRMDLMNT